MSSSPKASLYPVVESGSASSMIGYEHTACDRIPTPATEPNAAERSRQGRTNTQIRTTRRGRLDMLEQLIHSYREEFQYRDLRHEKMIAQLAREGHRLGKRADELQKLCEDAREQLISLENHANADRRFYRSAIHDIRTRLDYFEAPLQVGDFTPPQPSSDPTAEGNEQVSSPNLEPDAIAEWAAKKLEHMTFLELLQITPSTVRAVLIVLMIYAAAATGLLVSLESDFFSRLAHPTSQFINGSK